MARDREIHDAHVINTSPRPAGGGLSADKSIEKIRSDFDVSEAKVRGAIERDQAGNLAQLLSHAEPKRSPLPEEIARREVSWKGRTTWVLYHGDAGAEALKGYKRLAESAFRASEGRQGGPFAPGLSEIRGLEYAHKWTILMHLLGIWGVAPLLEPTTAPLLRRPGPDGVPRIDIDVYQPDLPALREALSPFRETLPTKHKGAISFLSFLPLDLFTASRIAIEALTRDPGLPALSATQEGQFRDHEYLCRVRVELVGEWSGNRNEVRINAVTLHLTDRPFLLLFTLIQKLSKNSGGWVSFKDLVLQDRLPSANPDESIRTLRHALRAHTPDVDPLKLIEVSKRRVRLSTSPEYATVDVRLRAHPDPRISGLAKHFPAS